MESPAAGAGERAVRAIAIRDSETLSGQKAQARAFAQAKESFAIPPAAVGSCPCERSFSALRCGVGVR